eukprot:s132_g42.t1
MTNRTHLKFAGLQRRTLAAYKLALERFLRFARSNRHDLPSPAQLDLALAEYLNSMYQEGEAVSAAGHAISGIKRFIPELRSQLPTASHFSRNWQKCHRPIRAVPISWELLQAMAALCWDQGSPHMALMLYVGFNCFLRTSEMLALQGCHLLPHHSKPEVAIVVPFSKTSNGNAQVLMVKDYNIWRLTRHVTRQRPSAALLWPGTPAQFRALWGQILLCLDFRSDDYTPYGIRRGGATWFFLETASLDATLARGRWSVSKTARSYVDDGTLTLARQHWSVAQRRNVHKAEWQNATVFAPVLAVACVSGPSLGATLHHAWEMWQATVIGCLSSMIVNEVLRPVQPNALREALMCAAFLATVFFLCSRPWALVQKRVSVGVMLCGTINMSVSQHAKPWWFPWTIGVPCTVGVLCAVIAMLLPPWLASKELHQRLAFQALSQRQILVEQFTAFFAKSKTHHAAAAHLLETFRDNQLKMKSLLQLDAKVVVKQIALALTHEVSQS